MLSKTALSAIQAFAVMAELPEGEHIGAGEIAERTGAGRNYLGKLLQSLAEAGLLQSRKGLGGGFRLAHDSKAISLFDVIDPIDHVGRWNGCFLSRAECNPDSPCALHDRWKAIREPYLRFLRETPISDLVRPEVRGRIESGTHNPE